MNVTTRSAIAYGGWGLGLGFGDGGAGLVAGAAVVALATGAPPAEVAELV